MTAAAAASADGRARRAARLEPGRIGVEAEADLAAALADERGEPVGEGRARAASALDARLQPGAGGELRHPAAGDRDPLAGARVDALARTALGDAELAEAGEVDLPAPRERVGDPVEDASTASAAAFLLSKLPAMLSTNSALVNLFLLVCLGSVIAAQGNSASRRITKAFRPVGCARCPTG